ncbi:MAG: DUF2793 domain-containing protein [Phycisphaerae bacterium]|nr:DUF2793 domain-containing protein [Phycisphaerae bacterium]
MATPPWPTFPVPASTDFSDWDFILPFFKAVWERHYAVGGATGDIPKTAYPQPDEIIDGCGIYAYDAELAGGNRWATMDVPAAVQLDGEGTAPPASPATNDKWAVLAGATGDWEGHDGEIATWGYSAGEWRWTFSDPSPWKEYQLPGGAYRIVRGSPLAWTDGTNKVWAGNSNKIANRDGSGNWSFEAVPENYYTVKAGSSVLIWGYDPGRDGYDSIWYVWDVQDAEIYSYLQELLECAGAKAINDTDNPNGFDGQDYIDNGTRAWRYGINRWRQLANIGRWADEEAYTTIRNSPYEAGESDIGCRLVVGNAATGDWASHSGEIAIWQGQDASPKWTFETPAEGHTMQAGGGSSGSTYNVNTAYISHSGQWESWSVGFTRKFPRVIDSLDDDGEDGQLARLTAPVNSSRWPYTPNYWGAKLVGIATSPPGEKHVGDDWAVAANATGNWENQDGKIATWGWSDGKYKWTFADPDTDIRYQVAAEFRGIGKPKLYGGRENHYYRTQYLYYISTGGAWQQVAATVFQHDGTAWQPCTTVDAEPDSVTDYGRGQAGDYIGPWIFNELKAGCDVIKWSYHETYNSHYPAEDRSEGFNGIWDTWAGAKASAEADFSWPDDGGTKYGEYWRVRMCSIGYLTETLNPPSENYHATILSGEAEYGISGFKGLSRTIDFYAATEKPTGSEDNIGYDNNGLNIQEDKWGKFTTEQAAIDDTSTTITLGDKTQIPVWCAAPTENNSQRLGWQLKNAYVRAVAKWNFEY